MYFQDQKQALADIRLRAESGGDAAYYDELRPEVHALAHGWDIAPLSKEELAMLIQIQFGALDHINRQQKLRE